MLKNKISFFFTILFLLYGPQNLFAQAQENPASLDQTKLDKKTESSYQLTVDKIDPSRFNNVAVIQGLNKIIAKTSLLEIKIGDTIKFGKLNITVHKCWQSPLEQKPESKILLEIYDTASSSEDDQSSVRHSSAKRSRHYGQRYEGNCCFKSGKNSLSFGNHWG